MHRDYLTKTAATLTNGARLGQNNVFETFWKQAATGEDQLRQRVTFALSQIFVVSLQDAFLSDHPVMVAGYYDTLAANAFGNFRSLLEAVSLHPAMGVYLTSLHNQKEDATRTPDENYAREVMQLMSIGLLELNPDGSQKKANGAPIETYTSADITGLAKVFTGWSWAGADKSNARFAGNGTQDPDRDWKPMQSYPQFHSTSEKSFLGVTVPAQSTANPEASLKVALDRLFNHPNVGPFIGKQLIQRLVVSNPSPAYVARVSAAFANDGQGVRGDMKAVIRAILLDPEAGSATRLSAIDNGKLREPILRLAGWMRAFGVTSASGRFLMTNLDDPISSLGQSPLRSPSVFNFYRPGYVPPNTAIASAGLVAPEMQLVGNTSVVGYLNTMRDIVPNGAGANRDVTSSYVTEIALANTPDKLIDRVDLLLLAGQMTPMLRTQILAALNSVAISATDTVAADRARKNRVWLSVFLTLASTEYLVQK
ncbi:DUF1800 family protein [Actimicrobium antarcticum]|uniref:DUF1800 family protein n=1 Tax=Actimicrobium antarcticum TaxID=1051899 RepID=A0ABP7TPW4_9BURK